MKLWQRILGIKHRVSLNGITDWHCHLLPGVDDGVQTLEQSLQVLTAYEEAGIANVWLTPHIMEDLPNTTQRLTDAYHLLLANYTGPIQLSLAAEYMLDNLFTERLEAGDLLPIGNGRTLLVETSYYNAPIGLERRLQAIRAAGYTPLLAHPERYQYIDALDTYQRLHDSGVQMQLNLPSLLGHYGPGARLKAQHLLKRGLYHCAATDTHRIEHIQSLSALRVDPDTHALVAALLNQ